MERRARWRRRGWRGLAAVIVFVAVALPCARLYLSSGAAGRMVARHLSAFLKTHAEMDRFRGALVGDSLVTGLRVCEEPGDEPFLTIDRLAAHLSVWSVLWGARLPDRIEIDQPRLRLRFDAQGKLLTRLPHLPFTGKLPTVHLHRAQLTVDQQGRAPFTLSDASVTLTPGRDENISGLLDDPVWGRWTMSGRLARDEVTLTLALPAARIDAPMLRTVPFIHPTVWERIEGEADGVPVRLRLELRKQAPQLRYRLDFAGVVVRLLQKDRPPATAAPVSGHAEGDALGMQGKVDIDDPKWGKWAARVDYLTAARRLTVQMAADAVQVDPARLEALPYVPPGVWKQVHATGPAAARAVVTVGPQAEVHHRIEVQPQGVRLHVAALGLDVENTCGDLLIEDGRVRVRRATGRAAGGTLSTVATLDFRGPPTVMRFDLDVRGLHLRQLPARWELPPQIDGKVTGSARLRVTVDQTGVHTHGSGDGQIDEARLVGFPTREPVRLTLRTDGERLRFEPHSPLLRTLLNGVGRQAPTGAGPAAPLPDGAIGPGGSLADATARLAVRLAEGAADGLAAAARAGAVLLTVPPERVEAEWAMADIDLAELVRRAGLRLPLPIAGQLSLRVRLSIPIHAARDLRAVRLHGSLEVPRLRLAGVELADVQARLSLADGLFRVESIRGETSSPGRRLSPGQFHGSATARLAPSGEAAFELAISDLPLELLASLAPVLRGRLAGDVRGRLRGGVNLRRAATPSAWYGQALLVSPVLDVADQSIEAVSLRLTLDGGRLQVNDLQGRCLGGLVTGSGRLNLDESRACQAELAWRGADLARLRLADADHLPRGGSLDLSASLRGRWSAPESLTAVAAVRGVGLHLAGWRLDELAGAVRLEKNRLTLHDLTCRLYRGVVSGTVALGWPGLISEIDLQLDSLDVAALAGLHDLPSLRLQGKVSGQVGASFRLASRTHGRVDTGLQTADGFVNLAIPEVTVQGVAARQLRGAVEFRGGKVGYQLRGETLGGTFSVEGKYPPPPVGSVGQPHGWLRVERVSLTSVAQAFRLGDNGQSLAGLLSLSLPYRHDGPEWLPVARGPFELRDLRLGDTEWADVVRGDVRLGVDGLSLRDVSGIVGGGQLRFSGRYGFRDPARGWFDLRLSRLEPARLLARDSEMRNVVQGPIDLALRGTLGAEWRGSGALTLSRGKIFGVEVNDVRLPLDVTHTPGRGQGELTVHEGDAQLGQGRAQLRATLGWGSATRLEGTLRLFDAALHRLAGLIGDVSSYARGRVNGRVDFAAADLRSASDLTANVQASLRAAQVLQLPVLQQLVPYLLPGQGTIEFSQGDVRGRLAGGVFRIAEMTLESPLAQLILEGSITLQGRLDLDVLAQTTRTGVNPVMLRLMLKALPPVGPVPLVVLLRANDILSDRVMRLKISGTLKAARVQVEPLRLLSEQAVRFFLTQALRSAK